METPLQISLRGISHSDALHKAIQEKARKLGKDLAAANARLADYERSMSEMDAKNKNQEAILKKRAEDLDNREKAIADLRARLQARDKALNDLRDKLRSALIQFPAADLSVEMRDGKVYIAISDKMLFKSGSDKVEPMGKEALEQVASVMKAYPDMDLIWWRSWVHCKKAFSFHIPGNLHPFKGASLHVIQHHCRTVVSITLSAPR